MEVLDGRVVSSDGLDNTNFTGIYWFGGDNYFEHWIDGEQMMWGWITDIDKMKRMKATYPEAYKTLIGLILSGK